MLQTQTIDIAHVQKILGKCPYYDYIVNYEYEEGDTLTSTLIDWYRDLIFSANANDEAQLKIVGAIDYSMHLYVRDNKYKRGLKKLITIDDFSLENKVKIKDVIKKIILFTNTYEKEEILEVSNSKWL